MSTYHVTRETLLEYTPEQERETVSKWLDCFRMPWNIGRKLDDGNKILWNMVVGEIVSDICECFIGTCLDQDEEGTFIMDNGMLKGERFTSYSLFADGATPSGARLWREKYRTTTGIECAATYFVYDGAVFNDDSIALARELSGTKE